MDGDNATSAPSRRGLGFFPPAVHIRSHAPPPPPGTWHDDDEYVHAGPSRIPPPLPPRHSWTAWKEWNINPTGHGGRAGPPVFVRAEGSYDELGRSIADGFGVQVEAEKGDEQDSKEDKLPGSAVADWYRSLSAGNSKAASPAPTPQPTSQTRLPTRTPPTPTAPAGESSTGLAPSTSALPPQPAPAPVRVHRSEWFIRRALASAAKDSPPPPAPRVQKSYIGSMLNIETARPAPPPIPRYALGPDNAGFARLAALGWGGGGLGRPEGWTEEDERRALARIEGGGQRNDPGTPRSLDTPQRHASEPTGRPKREPPEVDGVVDLTADSSDEDEGGRQGDAGDTERGGGAQMDDEVEQKVVRSGPGRTSPIATALKFNRLGLGRVAADKRVTHSRNEIEQARRRGAGKRHDGQGEPSKKAKVKWAQRERKEREHRARIAAALR